MRFYTCFVKIISKMYKILGICENQIVVGVTLDFLINFDMQNFLIVWFILFLVRQKGRDNNIISRLSDKPVRVVVYRSGRDDINGVNCSYRGGTGFS